MESRTLNATIQELLLIFREALVSLIPSMEKAKIPWRDPDAYDDWDSIAMQVFSSIVENACREVINDAFPIPQYGMTMGDYSELSFIDVSSRDSRVVNCVLICLTTKDLPFDTVRIQTLDPATRRGMTITEIPWESAQFGLSVNKGGRVSRISHVSVTL